MHNPKIGAAVIGLGGMGRWDVETLQNGARDVVAEVTGYDICPETMRRAQEAYGIRTHDSLDQLWADETVQLVYICTSNASHVPLAIAAVEVGKAVMCEKPFGLNREDTIALCRAVRCHDGWFQPGFECRNYSRLYKEIKDIIDSGEIGNLVHINQLYVLQPWSRAGWRASKQEAGGFFQEKLCHYVDLPRWWADSSIAEFVAVKAPNVTPDFELIDNVELSYRFETGCVAHLSFLSGPAYESRMTVDPELAQKIKRLDEFFVCQYVFVGTEGGITADLWSREMRLFHHDGKGGLERCSEIVRLRTWDENDDFLEFHNTWDQNLDIARRVAAGQPPLLDVWTAAETMLFCFACEDALAAGTWTVKPFTPAFD